MGMGGCACSAPPMGVDVVGVCKYVPFPLHVEYAELRKNTLIIFMFSLFHEYSTREYVRICHIQGYTGRIRYSYWYGCVPGIREYIFNT